MRDQEFLHWLADRLVHVYKEDPSVDFVTKLTSIANRLLPDQVTPNVDRYLDHTESAKADRAAKAKKQAYKLRQLPK